MSRGTEAKSPLRLRHTGVSTQTRLGIILGIGLIKTENTDFNGSVNAERKTGTK